MQGSYLGPLYPDLDVELMAKRYKAPAHYYDKFDELADKVAEIISTDNVVGWFQGRMEFGPRALGGRSILGDPRSPEMQKKLNLKIKYRESFRPFAPSVLAEQATEYFELTDVSPYMLIVADVRENRRKPIPDNYYEMPLMDRLYVPRSDLQAITHLDFSARVQSVHKETNPKYHLLLEKFRDKTGFGMLVNTSFNVRGEPIVCTPEDAYRCFMRTEMDYLVINNFMFSKTEQPEWKEKDNWKTEFTLD